MQIRLKQGGLDKNGSCVRADFTFGLDYPEVRISVHKVRQHEAECRIVLDEQNHLKALDRGSAQAIILARGRQYDAYMAV